MAIILFVAFFVVIMCVAIVAGVLSGIKQSTPKTSTRINYINNATPAPPKKNEIDLQNLPPRFSSEEREYLRKVGDFCGKRFITHADLRRYTIHSIGKDFAAMSGWDIWDMSIHNAPGQYERMERGALQDISILSYNPEYRIAKTRGMDGSYLTSCKRCSCPDFRTRHLPCKHMYLLAMELDGDINKLVQSQEYAPLYGLKFALAGHFPKNNESPDGVRSYIENQGGNYTDTVSRNCSALITGTSPSAAKLEKAAYYDMEVLPCEAIKDLIIIKNQEPIANQDF